MLPHVILMRRGLCCAELIIASLVGSFSLAPWISAAPGLVIVALAAAFSLFGDGLADYLRPEIER